MQRPEPHKYRIDKKVNRKSKMLLRRCPIMPRRPSHQSDVIRSISVLTIPIAFALINVSSLLISLILQSPVISLFHSCSHELFHFPCAPFVPALSSVCLISLSYIPRRTLGNGSTTEAKGRASAEERGGQGQAEGAVSDARKRRTQEDTKACDARH